MSEEIKKEEGEEKVPSQEISADEKNNPDGSPKEEKPTEDQPKEGEEGGEEFVKIPKKDHEKLVKKATDFDGIVEKNRIEKLAKKNQPEKKKEEEENLDGKEDDKQIDKEAIIKEATEAAIEAARGPWQEVYKENLTQAFQQFVKENPWADNDDVIQKISSEFTPGTAIRTPDLIDKINSAAIKACPNEYKSYIEENAKRKALVDEDKINVGDAGNGKGVKKDSELESEANQKNIQKRLEGNLPPGFTSVKK